MTPGGRIHENERAGTAYLALEAILDATLAASCVRSVILELAVSARIVPPDLRLAPATSSGLRLRDGEFVSPLVDDQVDWFANVAVPPNWLRTKLGNLIELRYGKALPKKARSSAGRVPVYGSNGQVGTHNEALVEGGCVVVGRKGSSGAVTLVTENCWPIDTAYFTASPLGIHVEYLDLLLRALRLDRLDRSTAIPGLNRADAYALTAAVPPLEEQKRIVARVRQLMALCDVLDAKKLKLREECDRHATAAFETLRGTQTTGDFWRAWSYISDHFDELLQFQHHVGSLRATVCEMAWRGALLSGVPQSAPNASVEALSTDIVDCPHSTPSWTLEGVACLRTNNFRVSGLDLTDVRRVSRGTYEERVARLVPRPGDVVYSREGGILGIACVIPPSLNPVCLGQRMMLIRPDPAKCIPEFLSLMLNSPRITSQVRSLTGGTASPHLNVSDVRKFEIPLPTVNQQKSLLAAATALLRRCDDLERTLSSRDTTAAMLAEALVKAVAGGGRARTAP